MKNFCRLSGKFQRLVLEEAHEQQKQGKPKTVSHSPELSDSKSYTTMTILRIRRLGLNFLLTPPTLSF
jgi:hypothetical protein